MKKIFKNIALTVIITLFLEVICIIPTSATTFRSVENIDAYSRATKSFRDPVIDWTSCSSTEDLECADLEVPLDYSNFNLGTIRIPLTRRIAANQNEKVGSLFTNPGGPGGEATTTTTYFSQALGEEVHQKFDVIGIGPRGIEGKELAMCDVNFQSLPTLDERVFPLNQKEIQQHFSLDRAIQKSCAKGPRILSHMSTADVARDMNQARKALGDSKINYYGTSYGTYIGSTYAALFPNNVRALILDGVVDPTEWAKGSSKNDRNMTVDERLGTGLAGKEALDAAINECEKAGVDKCATANTIRSDWDILKQNIHNKYDVSKGDYQIRPDEILSLLLNTLYSPETIPETLNIIHDLSTEIISENNKSFIFKSNKKSYKRLKELSKISKEISGVDSRQENYEQYYVGYAAVLCSDSLNPSNEKAFINADTRAWAETDGFGQLWNWQTSVCSHWPIKASNVYRGPFNIPTSSPILIIGNEHDPATPYIAAKRYHQTLPTSRLLTVKNGFGHGSLGISQCVDKVRTEYLVQGTAPAKDTVCEPDNKLYN